MIWDAVSEGATLKDVRGIPLKIRRWTVYMLALMSFGNRGSPLKSWRDILSFMAFNDFQSRLHHGTGGGMLPNRRITSESM